MTDDGVSERLTCSNTADMAEKTACCISIAVGANAVHEEISQSDEGVDHVNVVSDEMVSKQCDDSCEPATKNAVCSNEYAVNPAKRTCYHSVVPANKESVELQPNNFDCMPTPFEEVNMSDILSQKVIKIEDDNETHLLSHKKQPCSDKERLCTICSRKSGRESMYVCQHVNVYFKSATFICNICTCTFRDENSFINHSKKHNGDKPFYCQFCNTWFVDLADLNSHTNDFQYRNLIHCAICGKRSARKFQVKFEKNKGSFTVGSKCRKLVYSSLYFCEQCHPRNTYDCEICGRMFCRELYLCNHYNTCHRRGGPFKCKECFASYSKRCMLEHHLEIHPGRQKPWVCHLCGFRFKVQLQYMNHLQNHKTLKPFNCDKCGKNFGFEGELKSHLDKHEVHAWDGLSDSLTVRYDDINERMGFVNKEGNDSGNACSEIYFNDSFIGMSTQAAPTFKTSSNFSTDSVQTVNVSDKNIGIKIIDQNDTILEISESDTTFQEHEKSISLDNVKQEVLSDDEAYVSIQEHDGIDENVGNYLFENRNPSVDLLNGKGMNRYFASQKHSSYSVSPGSSCSAMVNSEGNHRQINNSGFSPSVVKIEIVSEEKCVASENTAANEENPKTIQQTREICVSDSVKQEVILEEGSVGEAVVENEINEISPEFCPLDFVSTEFTSCKTETPITDVTYFSSMSHVIVDDTECISPKESYQSSEALLKTEFGDTIASEELNIKVDIKEEISDSSFVETCVKKEVDCSPSQSICDVDEDGWRNLLEQQSDMARDNKLPFHQESQHESAFPASSWRDIKLETDQRRLLLENSHDSGIRHCCCICHSFMESSVSLLQHYRSIHHFEPRAVCKICMEPFDTLAELRSHKINAHKVNMRCPLCERKFFKRSVFMAHLKKHSGDVPYFCTICQMWFRDLDELQHHRTSAIPHRQLHYCTRCGEKNAWKFEMNRNKGRMYICEECGKFTMKRLVTCETCGQLFRSLFFLESHYIFQHTGRHSCRHCDMVFDSACVKEGHRESMCGTLKMFTCTACGRWFQSQNTLDQHKHIHNMLSLNYE